MKILDDILSTLNFDAPVRDIRQGVFHTAVLTRYVGLAATLPKDALGQETCLVREPGFLLDRSSEDLARMAYSESILEAAIGMATINSLLDVDLTACRELNAADLILEKGADKNVAVIGHFPGGGHHHPSDRILKRGFGLAVLLFGPVRGLAGPRLKVNSDKTGRIEFPRR